MKAKLFYGGPIITMDESMPNPEAVLVIGDTIAAVGKKQELQEQATDAECIDLQGQALLPGFIDAHSHIVQFSNTLQFARLNGVTSKEELQKRLQEFVRTNEITPEQIVIGFGYDNNDLPKAEHPTRQWLDEALPGYLVMVCHASGHMGCVNTSLLEKMQITSETPNPKGGRIGRDEQGQPTGYLEETAFTLPAANLLGEQPEADVQALLQKAQQMYFGYGITTAQDGLMKQYEYEILDTAAKQGKLKLDVVGYADIREYADLGKQHPEYCKTYKNHFKIGGYKLFLDGSPQGRTAWVTKPYLNGEEGYCGYPVYSDDEVCRFVDKAKQDNMQLLCHCNGDAAAAQFLQAHKEPSECRNVMIHAQLLRPDQLPEVKEKKIIPSFFVAHTWHWGDVHVKNFGQERAENISPVGDAVKLGIPFTFHMDSPVLPPDCIDSIYCAVNRITKAGKSLAAGQEISVYEALKGVTIYGAYQYHEEDEKGSITPGKKADLVVLSEDPQAVEPMQLRRIQVKQTYKDGDLVYSVDEI